MTLRHAARNLKRAKWMLADLPELYNLASLRPNVVRKQICELADVQPCSDTEGLVVFSLPAKSPCQRTAKF